MANKKTDHKLSKTLPEYTLNDGEYHPAAPDAVAYLNALPTSILMELQEAFAATCDGSRTSQICFDTITRVLGGQAVADRYILGLAWTIRNLLTDEGLNKSDAES